MAAAFVQGNKGITTGAAGFTFGLAFTGATTRNNAIVVAIGDDSGSTSSITSITDTYSNSYTKLTAASFSVSVSIWIAVNIASGSGHTVTCHTASDFNAPGSLGMAIAEWSGLGAVQPDKIQSNNNTTSTTTPTSGASAATTYANEAVIAAFAPFTETITAGTGYSNLLTQSASGGASNAGIAMESKTISATGSQTATFTANLSTGGPVVMVTLFAPLRTTKTHTTNSVIRKVNTRTHTTDTLKRIQTSKTQTTNALIRKAFAKVFTTNSLTRQKQTLTRVHTTNANLAYTRHHSTSSQLRKVYRVTHTTDYSLQTLSSAVKPRIKNIVKTKARAK